MDLQLELLPYHYYNTLGFKKVSAELFYSNLFDLIAQALKLKDFLFPTLAGIDSRPVWANVNGYKHKRCTCSDQSLCACEKQLGYSFAEAPFFYGPVPQASMLQEQSENKWNWHLHKSLIN